MFDEKFVSFVLPQHVEVKVAEADLSVKGAQVELLLLLFFCYFEVYNLKN